jgi:hypothetical protein
MLKPHQLLCLELQKGILKREQGFLIGSFLIFLIIIFFIRFDFIILRIHFYLNLF